MSNRIGITPLLIPQVPFQIIPVYTSGPIGVTIVAKRVIGYISILLTAVEVTI